MTKELKAKVKVVFRNGKTVVKEFDTEQQAVLFYDSMLRKNEYGKYKNVLSFICARNKKGFEIEDFGAKWF